MIKVNRVCCRDELAGVDVEIGTEVLNTFPRAEPGSMIKTPGPPEVNPVAFTPDRLYSLKSHWRGRPPLGVSFGVSVAQDRGRSRETKPSR
jgi:hypothetical protein